MVQLGAGNILLLLLIAALLCIILGMGMPTLGVYVLLAVLIAPALVEVGISPLAAHMFILYLGMMSFVTPPLAIAAFFAANLAKGDPMKTGWYAMRFSWAAYIIPFLFVFSPTLLLQSDSWVAIAISISTAAIGVWFVSASMIGYGLRPMPLLSRLAGGAGGVMLLIPPEAADWAGPVNLVGLAIVIGVFTLEVLAWRARPRRTRRGRAPNDHNPSMRTRKDNRMNADTRPSGNGEETGILRSAGTAEPRAPMGSAARPAAQRTALQGRAASLALCGRSPAFAGIRAAPDRPGGRETCAGPGEPRHVRHVACHRHDVCRHPADHAGRDGTGASPHALRLALHARRRRCVHRCRRRTDDNAQRRFHHHARLGLARSRQ